MIAETRIFDVNAVVDRMVDDDGLGLDAADEFFASDDAGDCPVEHKAPYRHIATRGVNELGMDFSNKWGADQYGYGYDN